ncbi:hypothetical protein IFT72_14970 [Frigoribacterium sp. CFBP 8754]|uniref:hypothetical protein n=1 Tax=Frigoribacterium sp. CFBP 8754 TaxID=2775290 RepID=UPI001786BAF7|nr:hypothetical protein [Frigoribacterium sp. CFBP 8754]MBD8661489.1 hypothetical protein [Frigoribacterium sp. CFBP 8754]
MNLAHTAATAPEPIAYSLNRDPIFTVQVWELSERERVIYELGFHTGFAARQLEVDQLNHEADRLYVAAFDHRNCSCWRGRRHNVTWR